MTRTSETPSLGTDEFVRLTEFERALSVPLTERRRSRSAPAPRRAARAELEELLRPALERGTCHVLFSGGRDSSALLAVAVHVARRVGADDPVPVTVRHPLVPEADERAWQELVLAHLGLDSQIVLEFDGEQSLLGEIATDSLARHGLIWPPAVHTHGAIYSQLPPSTVVTGEGGDLLLSGRRITPLADVLRSRELRSVPRTALTTLLPGRLGRRRAEVDAAVRRAAPWLRPEAAQALEAEVAESLRQPLSWRRSVVAVASARPIAFGSRNFTAMVRSYGHEPSNPFEEPSFAAALAADGGFWGVGDRTAVMRHLFRDLLPDEVLARSTKASFNRSFWTSREVAFAHDWNGAGIDDRLIDREVLRKAWMTGRPSPMADIHLHAAWLGHHGYPAVPA